MKKFILVSLLLFALEALLFSCELFCPCGCHSGPEKQMDILGWGITTVDKNRLVVTPTSMQPFDQVYKLIYVNESKLVVNEPEWDNVGGKALYACSPKPVKAIQAFNGIRIHATSDTPYLSADDSIKAGDDITHRFVMESYDFMNFKPVEEFTDGREIHDQDRFWIRLKDKPYQPVTLHFDIHITLSDGKVFELKNEQLVVD